MGKMAGGLFVVLLLHGLAANQRLNDFRKPTAREYNVHMDMEKFVARGKRVSLLQPDWVIKLIHEKYGDLEKNLVMTQTITVMSMRVF